MNASSSDPSVSAALNRLKLPPTDPNAITTINQLTELVNSLSADAYTSNGVLYTGTGLTGLDNNTGSYKVAVPIARQLGWSVIDDTPRGQFLSQGNIKTFAVGLYINQGLSLEQAKIAANILVSGTPGPTLQGTSQELASSFWGQASKEFSQSIKGEAIAIVGSDSSIDRIFGAIELPNCGAQTINGIQVSTLPTDPTAAFNEVQAASLANFGPDGIASLKIIDDKGKITPTYLLTQEGASRFGVTSANSVLLPYKLFQAINSSGIVLSADDLSSFDPRSYTINIKSDGSYEVTATAIGKVESLDTSFDAKGNLVTSTVYGTDVSKGTYKTVITSQPGGIRLETTTGTDNNGRSYSDTKSIKPDGSSVETFSGSDANGRATTSSKAFSPQGLVVSQVVKGFTSAGVAYIGTFTYDSSGQIAGVKTTDSTGKINIFSFPSATASAADVGLAVKTLGVIFNGSSYVLTKYGQIQVISQFVTAVESAQASIKKGDNVSAVKTMINFMGSTAGGAEGAEIAMALVATGVAAGLAALGIVTIGPWLALGIGALAICAGVVGWTGGSYLTTKALTALENALLPQNNPPTNPPTTCQTLSGYNLGFQAAPAHYTPIYNSSGYDQYGYNSKGYTVYGRNIYGQLDPTIGPSGEINTNVINGVTTKVQVNQDGSSVRTTSTPNGPTYIESRNSNNNLISTQTIYPDGSTIQQNYAPGSLGSITVSSTASGNLNLGVQTGITLVSNPKATNIGASTINKAQDGSITTISAAKEGSRDVRVALTDGTSLDNVYDSTGNLINSILSNDNSTLLDQTIDPTNQLFNAHLFNGDGTTITHTVNSANGLVTTSVDDPNAVNSGSDSEISVTTQVVSGTLNVNISDYNDQGTLAYTNSTQQFSNGSSLITNTNYDDSGNQLGQVVYNETSTGATTVSATGVNSSTNANSSTITLSDGAQTTLNGSSNTINLNSGDSLNFAGTGNIINDGYGDSLFESDNFGGNTINLPGLASSTTPPATIEVSGDKINILKSGGTVDIGGVNNTISASGTTLQFDSNNQTTIALTGTGDIIHGNSGSDSVTLNGASSALTLDGTGGNLKLTGIGDVINLSGTGNSLTVSGTGEQINATQDTINLTSGVASSFSLSGDGNTVHNLAKGDALKLLGSNESLTVDGVGGAITLAGTGDNVTLAGAANSLTLGGTGLTVTATNSTITGAAGLSGSFNGSGNTLNLVAATKTAISVSGTNQIIDASNEAITLGSGFTGSVVGSNDTIIMADNTGTIVSVSGTGNIINGDSGSNDVILVNSKATATVHGTNGNINVQGTGTVLTASNSYVTIAKGISLNLNGTSDSVTGTNDIVTTSSGFLGNFGGDGMTVNMAAGTNSGIGLYGSHFTVNGNSTNNYVNLVNSGEVGTVNGSKGAIQVLASGDSLTTTGEYIYASDGEILNLGGQSNSFIGNNDTLNLNSGFLGNLSGDGLTVNMTSGTKSGVAIYGSKFTVSGDTSTNYVNLMNAGASGSVAGDGGTIQVFASGDTLSTSHEFVQLKPTGATLNIGGTSDSVTASASTINTAGGFLGNIGGNNLTINMTAGTNSGVGIYGTAFTVNGDSNLNYVDLVNANEVGTVNGTGGWVQPLATGEKVTTSNEKVLVQDLANTTITGTNNAITAYRDTGITINGINNPLTGNYNSGINYGGSNTGDVVRGSSDQGTNWANASGFQDVNGLEIYYYRNGNSFQTSYYGIPDANFNQTSQNVVSSGFRPGVNDGANAYISQTFSSYNFSSDPVSNFGSGSGTYGSIIPGPGGVDPVVLNLSGKQIQTVNALNSPAHFDMLNNGKRVQTGWVTPGEGILVDDPTNAPITKESQLLSGFGALENLDSNGDHILDSHDSVWQQLKVWVDTTGTGMFQQGQLFSLDKLGISSINLRAQTVDKANQGNEIIDQSTFTMASGSKGNIAGVKLAFDPNQLQQQLHNLINGMASFDVPSGAHTSTTLTPAMLPAQHFIAPRTH